MPAPIATVMAFLAKTKFALNVLKVPSDWKQPMGDPAAKHYNDAFAPSEMLTMPGIAIPPLFLPASLNKYHTDTQKMLNEKFGEFIDGICSAICSAWSTWQSSASLVGVIVNAIVAAGGQVVGPPLAPLILANGPKATPMQLAYTNAVATTLGTGWLSYTATIKVPGLPWYPAFAAFPGPVAPPMPNIPMPLIALTQVTASVSPDLLKNQMIGLLANPTAPYHQELFDGIAFAVDKCLLLWQVTTLLNNVLGLGPIPTFAPPYVPVGPVLGGVANMIPGGFT